VRKLLCGAIVLALLVVGTACGGGSSSKTPTAPARTAVPTSSATSSSSTPGAPDESTFAKTMLLTLADFPSGWISSPNSDADESNNPLTKACGNAAQQGRSGRSTSDDFQATPNSVAISESLVIFPDEASASSAIENVPALVDCTVKSLNDGTLDTNQVKFSAASSSVVPITAPGDKIYSYQVKATVGSSDAPGQTQDVYLLIAYIRVGRINFSIRANGSTAPIDAGEISGYAQKASAKIRQQP